MAPKPEPARLAFVFGKESRILQPVSPVLVAFAAILLTSVVLLAVDSFIDTEALAFIYLLPTVVMAMHYGSSVGVLTSFASALAAAYFCFPPKLSFYISDPLNVAELAILSAARGDCEQSRCGRDEGRSRDKVHLNTAKQARMTGPGILLARADKVIE